MVTKLSVLDLAPVVQGSNPTEALQHSLDLIRHAEAWGYNRYWVAEHHNMRGIASSATAVVIGYLAGGTKSIRVGAGGIMLPNHAPLVIAEQFGTLASLYPDRIDLGLGRAPGTDQLTMQALRRTLAGEIDAFPRDVSELQHYLKEPQPGQRIIATPGAGTNVPIWILGSSLYGAQLAAMMGLPYAFASHFAPQYMEPAIQLYRENFKPSEQLQAPYVMLGFNVCAADDEEEAHYLRTSSLQSFLNLRRGMPGQLPPPVHGMEVTPGEHQMIQEIARCSAVGDPVSVAAQMNDFIEKTGADELMLVCSVFEHKARLRSYELAMEASRSLAVA
ncbi:MAG: LLM class flavin-dependent oxidoreductase [Pseudomonadales bacterium]|nr:LLM class flavin-dependent oxidoreductase [Pseudomonadales bacterium]